LSHKIEKVLQRIQTIYLFIAALVAGLLIFFIPLYGDSKQVMVWAKSDALYLALFLGSAALSIGTIFLYKKRQNQFVLGRLNILLNFAVLGVLVYRSQILSGGAAALEKGIGMAIPLVSIVFIALANKAIKRDEDLVKSVDRLR